MSEQNAPLWLPRYATVLRSWIGTPWVAGQHVKGKGADCVNFVVAVLDEMYQIQNPVKLERQNQQLALHNPKEAFRVAHQIASRYPNEVIKLEDVNNLQPADALVIRNSKNGGPGHILLVGDDPRVVWHSLSEAGVCYTSLSAFGSLLYVEKIWRLLEKERWLLS